MAEVLTRQQLARSARYGQQDWALSASGAGERGIAVPAANAVDAAMPLFAAVTGCKATEGYRHHPSSRWARRYLAWSRSAPNQNATDGVLTNQSVGGRGASSKLRWMPGA